MVVSALGACEDYGIVEFVGWFIVDLLYKAENDWRDIGRPQVAMHRNIAAFCSCFFCAYIIHIRIRLASYTLLNSTSCNSPNSSKLDAFGRMLGRFRAVNQTNQHAPDRIKLGGVDEWVGANVEK